MVTYASGGAFSKYSHEFQVLSEVGEDHLFVCEKCPLAINREIIEEQSSCPECGNSDLIEKRGIEVGNIFKLGTKFSESFQFQYTDEQGKKNLVLMGCYGIGPSRIMGTLGEIFNDAKGILWPKSVTPYQVHLLSLGTDENGIKEAEKLYETLQKAGFSVLYDDRDDRAGVKLNDADLIGIPLRLVLSSRTLEKKGAEWKERDQGEARGVALNNVVEQIRKFYSE